MHYTPMLATYHLHTGFSDGKGSLEETIESAIAQNIAELGISDHYTLDPAGRTHNWSMSTRDLPGYFDALDEAKKRYADRVVIRRGLEVDWFPDHGDAIRAALEPFDERIDYLVGSVHFVGGMCVDTSPAAWAKLTQPQRNEVHRQYWLLLREMAGSGLFDIIAHIDLPKKFGYLPDVDLTADIHRALDAVAEHQSVVEVNTAGWHKPVADAYPTVDILRACLARDIPATLSSDSHRPADLLRDFRPAADRLREAGYSRVARVGETHLRFESLDEAVRGLEDQVLTVSVDAF